MSSAGQPKTHDVVTRGGNALRRYQRVVVGRSGLLRLLYFELCTWLGPLPGVLGLAARRALWPWLFGSCGAGTVFGTNVSLRHPHRIHLGERVVVSDGCILDARTADTDRVIVLGDDTILGNGVMISCKTGSVQIGARTGIGAQSIIHAVAEARVQIGDDAIIGPGCYIAGGGNYHTERTDVPMAQQGLHAKEHTVLGDDVWLGAKVTVLPGTSVGNGSIGAAGAVMRGGVPARTIVGGVPARVLGQRRVGDGHVPVETGSATESTPDDSAAGGRGPA